MEWYVAWYMKEKYSNPEQRFALCSSLRKAGAKYVVLGSRYIMFKAKEEMLKRVDSLDGLLISLSGKSSPLLNPFEQKPKQLILDGMKVAMN